MLTSVQNPFVKRLRKLRRARDRHQQQQFLLEGTHLLQEGMSAQWPLVALCFTPKWRSQHPELWEQAVVQVQRAEEVSDDVLKAIATTVHPDGVVALAERQAICQPLNHRINLGIALDALQDPGNLGAIIRTAAAVGADGLWLTNNSVDLDHPKVLRSTAGQWFKLPMTTTNDLHADLDQFQASGVQVAATLPTAGQSYWDADLTRPMVILMGNEGAGISPELAQRADIQLRIPVVNEVESLNVAIATALILYEIKRQQYCAGNHSDSKF
jgi:TrmH family RNA methyltransferase